MGTDHLTTINKETAMETDQHQLRELGQESLAQHASQLQEARQRLRRALQDIAYHERQMHTWNAYLENLGQTAVSNVLPFPNRHEQPELFLIEGDGA